MLYRRQVGRRRPTDSVSRLRPNADNAAHAMAGAWPRICFGNGHGPHAATTLIVRVRSKFPRVLVTGSRASRVVILYRFRRMARAASGGGWGGGGGGVSFLLGGHSDLRGWEDTPAFAFTARTRRQRRTRVVSEKARKVAVDTRHRPRRLAPVCGRGRRGG